MPVTASTVSDAFRMTLNSHAVMTRFSISSSSFRRRERLRLPRFDLVQSRGDVVRELREMLVSNVLPFWTDGILDETNGGYMIPRREDGKAIDQSKRFLVYQTRVLWFFSRLYESDYGRREHLELARHGFEYISRSMWDPDKGGFFWKIDRDSGRPLIADKHLYGQAFALFALSRYAHASGDRRAADLAEQLFQLIENQRDRSHGGYRESVDRAWNPLPSKETSCIGVGNDVKSLNTHLHLLESCSENYRMRPSGAKEERIADLVRILTRLTVQDPPGACPETFRADWEPVPHRRGLRVSYGHDMELAWLLLAAASEVSSISPDEVLHAAGALVSYALEHGLDRERGGIFESGPLGRAADRKDKIWWGQAEGLLATLRLYLATGEGRYADAFSSTLSWIAGVQIDRDEGDWHHRIGRKERPHGYKAGEWKTPYHNGRAILDCLELLEKGGGEVPTECGGADR